MTNYKVFYEKLNPINKSTTILYYTISQDKY